MNRWLLGAIGACALTAGILLSLRQPRNNAPEPAQKATARRMAPVISPHRLPGKATPVTAADCPDCKPDGIGFTPPVASERVLGHHAASGAETSEATRHHTLNARLARHLAQNLGKSGPEQARARAAQEKNLELRNAAIERSGVKVAGPERP